MPGAATSERSGGSKRLAGGSRGGLDPGAGGYPEMAPTPARPGEWRPALRWCRGAPPAPSPQWLSGSATAWTEVLDALTPGERATIVATMRAYETALDKHASG